MSPQTAAPRVCRPLVLLRTVLRSGQDERRLLPAGDTGGAPRTEPSPSPPSAPGSAGFHRVWDGPGPGRGLRLPCPRCAGLRQQRREGQVPRPGAPQPRGRRRRAGRRPRTRPPAARGDARDARSLGLVVKTKQNRTENRKLGCVSPRLCERTETAGLSPSHFVTPLWHLPPVPGEKCTAGDRAVT